MKNTRTRGLDLLKNWSSSLVAIAVIGAIFGLIAVATQSGAYSPNYSVTILIFSLSGTLLSAGVFFGGLYWLALALQPDVHNVAVHNVSVHNSDASASN